MSRQSIIAVVIIIAAVIAVPLWLKSRGPAEGDETASQEPAGSKAEPIEAASGEALVSDPGPAASAAEPAAALPRFVDLGTTTCAPCRTMLGVMDELKAQYPGSLEVEFINIHEDRSAIQTYGLRAIPTQVFYSPGGEELWRHTGVLRTSAVVAKWAELGYPLTPAAPLASVAQ